MAYKAMAYIVMALIGMARIGMACIVTACMGMACIVMAYIVMALYSHGVVVFFACATPCCISNCASEGVPVRLVAVASMLRRP